MKGEIDNITNKIQTLEVNQETSHKEELVMEYFLKFPLGEVDKELLWVEKLLQSSTKLGLD